MPGRPKGLLNHIIKLPIQLSNLFLVVCFILLLAALPLVLQQSEGKISIRFLYFLLGYDYLKGLFDGSAFLFSTGRFINSIWDHLPRYFFNTLFYVTISSILGILIGFPIGMLRYKKRFSKSQKFLFFLNTIPDFFLIIILQISVVYITQFSGVRLASIAMVTRLPLLLPIFAMSFYPALYLIKQISNATYVITSQDYILFSLSQGHSRLNIFIKQVMPALLHELSADVTKVTLLVLSNVFIAEQLFRIMGITRMMFLWGFRQPNPFGGGGYQYAFVVNCLLFILVLYLIVSNFLKLIIRLLIKLRGA